MRKRSLTALAVALSLLFGSSAPAQDAPPKGTPMTQQDRDRLTAWSKLAGVKRVALFVEVSSSVAQFLKEEQIKNDVELALRSREIMISDNPSQVDGILKVVIAAVTDSTSPIYSVRTSVSYETRSVPNKMLLFCVNQAKSDSAEKARQTIDCLDFYSSVVTVWEKDDLLLLGRQKLDTARRSVKDLVDGFILEWMRVNQKQQ